MTSLSVGDKVQVTNKARTVSSKIGVITHIRERDHDVSKFDILTVDFEEDKNCLLFSDEVELWGCGND